jgi:hypothetical protein
LGDVAFFQKTHFSVSLRFPDDHEWWRFSNLPKSMKTPQYVAEFRLRDVDGINGRLSLVILDRTGAPLVQSDKLLREYMWSGTGENRDGCHVVELYDLNNHSADVPKGEDLKLRFSYSGDPSLTSHGYLALELWPK